jgi:hypothetical protein
MRHIRLDQPEKSAMAEHSINTGHQIDFNKISVLDRTSEYMDRLVNEAIQMRLNKKNFNRDSGFTMSQGWNPLRKLMFEHDTDPGKAAIEPANRSQAAKDQSYKRAGPDINWTD